MKTESLQNRPIPRTGDIFRHFKRERYDYDTAQYLYKIIDVATDSESEEQLVVYRQLYYPYKMYVRPLEMFMSEVDHAKYPEIRQKWRFEKLADGPVTVEWCEQKRLLLEAYRYQNREVLKNQILFVGSSLMEMFPVDRWMREIPGAPVCYNRGVGGFTTVDMLIHLDEMVLELEPARIFINIGTNDLSNPSIPLEQMIANYGEILDRIREALPECEIILMAYYPGNFEAAAETMKATLAVRTNEKIARANALVEQLAAEKGLRFIDINEPLKDSEGRLKAEYTTEGLHINEAGYRAILPGIVEEVMSFSAYRIP